LLAGGKSTRMGQDKAFLPVQWEGGSVPLWKRQLAILESLAPDKIVISGPRKEGYPASVAVWADEWKDVGPLGGIATCLSRTRSTLLFVVAIDLPQIQPGFLKQLLSRSEAGSGVVPVFRHRFEPLIAIYPVAALRVALAQLREEDYILQHFVDQLLKNHLVVRYEVESSEQNQLENWNTPGDVRDPPS
jgi:molybdopterin-guanine dinucleotide biosynthesis protein A